MGGASMKQDKSSSASTPQPSTVDSSGTFRTNVPSEMKSSPDSMKSSSEMKTPMPSNVDKVNNVQNVDRTSFQSNVDSKSKMNVNSSDMKVASPTGVFDFKKDFIEVKNIVPETTVFFTNFEKFNPTCFPGEAFTIFVPVDSAMTNVKFVTVEEFCNFLNDVVVTQPVVVKDVKGSKEFTTVSGKKVVVKTEGDKVFVNDAKVVTKEVTRPDGVVVFFVDKVLK
jgi:hypothetical protein